MSKIRNASYVMVWSVAIFGVSPLFAFGAGPQADGNDLLTIGSKAPAIDAGYWFSENRDGTKKGTFDLEQGKVYVVEFWATWCVPCVQLLPEMMEIQEELQGQNVSFLYISYEKSETVKSYLEKLSSREGRQRDIKKRFLVATDPDGSVYRDYVEKAGLEGVPHVFVVGKTSEIEWIGHPLDLREPLKAIVEDRWDRNTIGKSFYDRQRLGKVKKQSRKALDAQDPDAAIQLVDQALKECEKGSKLYSELLNLKCLAHAFPAQLKLFREGKVQEFYSMLEALQEQHSDPEMRAGFEQYELFVSVKLKNYDRLALILDRRTNRFLPSSDAILEVCHALHALDVADTKFPQGLRKSNIDAVQVAMSAMQNPKRQVIDTPLAAGLVEAQKMLADLYSLDGQHQSAKETQRAAIETLRELLEESESKLNELK